MVARDNMLGDLISFLEFVLNLKTNNSNFGIVHPKFKIRLFLKSVLLICLP